MTLVGGLGTVLGPVVGAFFLTAMQHYLAQLGSWVTVVQGVIFVFCVLVFRRGIVGVIAPYAMGRRARPEPPPEEIEVEEEEVPSEKIREPVEPAS